MLQKTRKYGEPTTPEPFIGGGAGEAARKAALAGKNAMSAIDKVAEDARKKQQIEQENARRQSVRRCGC